LIRKLLAVLLSSVMCFGQSGLPVMGSTQGSSGGGSAPTAGTSSRGGDAFACFHTLTCTTGNITVVNGQPIVTGISAETFTTITGLTDTCGAGSGTSTWTLQTTATNPAPGTTSVYTAIAGKSGTCTVTLTLTGANAYSRLVAVPVSGANASTPIGASTSQDQILPGTGANAVTSGNFSTTTSNNLVIGWSCDIQGSTDTYTAGTSPVTFTLIFSNYDGGNFACALETGTVAAASTISATFTASTGGAGQIMTAGIAIQP